MYLVSSFGFFAVAGVMALIMRAELSAPGLQVVSPEQYDQLFTAHGTIMMLLFATPVAFGFANYLVPLQIGAPDVAFPRLNALAYGLYLFGGLMVVAGFITPGGAADVGWTANTPLSDDAHSPGAHAARARHVHVPYADRDRAVTRPRSGQPARPRRTS